MRDGELVTFGGVLFRVVQVNHMYKTLVPVNDPFWMLKYLTPEPKTLISRNAASARISTVGDIAPSRRVSIA